MKRKALDLYLLTLKSHRPLYNRFNTKEDKSLPSDLNSNKLWKWITVLIAIQKDVRMCVNLNRICLLKLLQVELHKLV